MKKQGRNISEIFYNGIMVLFLLIFMPILFCVFWFGTDMDYFYAIKLETLCSNRVLFVLIAILLFIIFAFFYIFRKAEMTKITGRVLNVGLVAASIIMYFVNVEISKCIYLEQGWDVESVVGAALELFKGNTIGEHSYFAIYPNNVPMSYFLYRLFELYDKFGNGAIRGDFFWVCVNCMMVSVTGFLGSMTVKKLTNSPMAVLLTFFLHMACVGITPWKTTPYTDMGALLFPVLCIFLYVNYYCTSNAVGKNVLWFLFLIAGFLGALVKPPVLVVVVAGVIAELIKFMKNFRAEWKAMLCKALIVGLVVLMYQSYKGYIYDQCDYVYNEAAAVTYHHYLLMGVNEYSTGGYDSNVLAFHGKFVDSDERIAAQWEEIVRQLRDRGFIGHLQFLLKKMVMSFNDGTFGWGREGQYYYYSYPILSDAFYSELMRDIFWPNFKYCGRFNTYSQLIWLLIIAGIPGMALGKNGVDRHLRVSVILSVLGVIAYLMLFEARARYLLCFSPALIVASVVGIWQYYVFLLGMLEKRRKNIEV